MPVAVTFSPANGSSRAFCPFDGAALVLLCLCVDAFFARPRRKIQAEVEVPPVGYIGEPVEAALVLSAADPAPERYELALDLGGEASPQTGVTIPTEFKLPTRASFKRVQAHLP